MKMNLEVRAIILAAVLPGFLVAGCGGGTETPDNNDNPAVIAGGLSVTGAQLADLADPAQTGELDEDKWALRVIDPTESLDSITIEHEDATFGAISVTPLEIYLLNFSLLPAVDLSGDGAQVTPLELEIAVPVAEGTATQVYTEIELVAPDGASALKSLSQSDGYRVRLRYTITGPRSESELLEIDWNHRRLRRDSNGNGMLDDEDYFVDSDRNGISDNRQQGYMGGQGSGQLVQASGTIEQVDVALGRVRIGGQMFLVDESTQIRDATGAALKLEMLQTGQPASASGHKGRFGNVYASVIELAAGQ